MFERVLIALDARTGGRDALVLGRQLTEAYGEIIVAAVHEIDAVPLVGGPRASARRRDRLRDGGQEVYATLAGDPRARYLELSGAPLGESVALAAARVDPHAVVIGEDVARGGSLRALLDRDRSWSLVIAPYGQRFVRAFEARRIGVVRTVSQLPPAAREGAAGTEVLSLASAASPEAEGLDLLVVCAGRLDAEVVHHAICPVLVPPSPWPSRGRPPADGRVGRR